MPIFIGTNANMFGQLARLCCEKGGEDSPCVLHIHSMERDAYQKNNREVHQPIGGPAGKILTFWGQAVVMPAGAQCVVEGTASYGVEVNNQVTLTESPEEGLPKGLLVQTGILLLSSAGVH